MKYKLFIILFCFLLSFSFAQKKVVYTSNGFILNVRNDEVEKNTLHSSADANMVFIDESRPGQLALPQKNIIVAIPENSKPRISIIGYRKSFVEKYKAVFNPITVQVNDSTLRTEEVSVPKPLMSEPEPMEVLGYFQLRDFYCVALKINTHQYDYSTQKCFLLDSLQIKFEFPEEMNYKTVSEVKEYSYFDSTLKQIILNWEEAQSFRVIKGELNEQNDSWINYSSNYLKIPIYSDKIYKLTKNDFDKLGINIESINPKTFQMFESGKVLPIEVQGEEDLNFDVNDYIEFLGIKNYSKKSPRLINRNEEEYNELMNRITDTTYYFLTWGSSVGKRVSPVQQSGILVADTLTYYDELLHLEEHPMDVLFYTFSESLIRNQFPFWETSKAWYWKWLASWSSVVSINFSELNTIVERSSKIYAKICSRGSNQKINPHYVTLHINSKIVDSTYLDRYGRVLLGGKEGRWIKEGNNLIELKYKENNGSTSGACVLDWLEIEYPKKLELQNDSLSFAYRTELPLKERWIKIEKAGDQTYAVYRVKPAYRKVTDYKIEKGSLYFRDSVGTGYEYAVCSEAKITTPFQIEIKKFANIREQIKEADYIAISHSKFRQAVNKYVANIASSMNLKTAAYFVNDIYDEFGFGYPTPESIKEFVKYLLANSPKPLPSYLTLIGDANYDYKGVRKKQAGVRVGENYVPSYGFPVSDPWYVIMDSINISLPQMYVGRIPINNESELYYYWSKVSENSTTRFDNWNKKFLFFSGGSGTQNELDVLKNVQQQVIDKYIKPVPLTGQSDHFYKITGNDFGPYSNEYVSKAIDEGAVFVSYLGHSGTATWDNSISDVSQLKSSHPRNYFVSDFGCSTNKFAEPDITSFGERFLLSSNGQALGYIGNSSLGFTSIAYAAPNLLFESFVKDKKNSIGEIHWLTKAKLFSQLGNSESARLFNYTNTLLGDPAIELQVPTKPNLFINERNISLNDGNIILDSQDSVSCKINFYNYGTSEIRNFSYKIAHIYNQKSIDVKELGKALPNFTDSVVTKLFVKDLPGIHSLKIQLDNKNEISEIYDDDNEVTLTFYVSANQVRDQLLSINSNGNINVLNVLSPQQKPVGDYRIVLKTGTDPNFESFELKGINPETFYTKVGLPQSSSLRHWFKFGFITNDTTWTKEKSYLPSSTSRISFNDLYSFAGLKSNDLLFSNSGIGFKKDTMRIGVISAGQFAGQTCIISLNGKNLLANSFFMGIGICTFNPVTYEMESSNWYELFNKPANHNAFETFVKSIPNGKLIAVGISGDAVNNNSTQFKNVLKSIGSTKADSIQYKGSWAFIGIKGGDLDTFIEMVKSPYSGLISINKDFEKNNSKGSIETEVMGPVYKWKDITIKKDGNPNLEIELTPVGFTGAAAKGDTLASIKSAGSKIDLEKIIPSKYSYLKFNIDMKDNSNQGIGFLKSIDLDFIGVPELGTNYQVVSISKDSLEQGEKASLNFSVYNVGESTASNFKVRVDLVKKDNSKKKLLEQVVDSIQTEKKKDFSLSYTTDKQTGSNQFQITIDTENAITELYKDNNFYSVPFYVKPNDKPASLKLTIDGNDIINGDFISSKPNLKIELNDESLIPITDTTKILLYLNNKRVYFANNTGVLNYNYSSSNPKMIVNYTPTLADGDYTLKVIGKNATDQFIDSTGIARKFTVKNELQLLNAYNYPNPFKDDTYFTFKLTQIPDELKIIIYTIAGRKIKEIKLNGSELKYDFNRIFWDGRDQDGDLAANGVYIYKIISQKGSEKTELTQKLSILR